MTEIQSWLGQNVCFDARGFPYVSSPTFQTVAGTPYLREPGVFMIARPDVSLNGLRHFFDSFDPSLGFGQYPDDPTELEPADQLVKFAGQGCYASFGPKRTMNDGAEGYLGNIKSSGHGSVIEHPNFSFFVHGISRSNSHEVVRHRAGFAYSQLSQRYVSGRVLRFVERPEYVDDPKLHAMFEKRIDFLAEEYERIAFHLAEQQQAGVAQLLSAEAKTDLRKKVQQTARSVLPNETETWMTVTGNARSWRHFIEMRANEHAEVEIRRLALYIYLCLVASGTLIVNDYTLRRLSDGTDTVETKWRKV